MADDLDRKIKQIADMFGVSDTSGLKNIVEKVMPQSSGSNQTPPPQDPGYSGENDPPSPPPSGNLRNSMMNPNFLRQASEMMNIFNNVSDSRITLLNSVQPFLGPQRQQRLGGAIQLLKVISIIGSIAPNINRNPKG